MLPAGPSRDVRFTYFAFSDSHAVELSNVVHVDALAPLTIRADRRRVTGARVVRLSGRVGGGADPARRPARDAAGLPAGWGWRTFRTVRTDRRGRWQHALPLPLERTAASASARSCRARARFPFATSRSSGVFVVVA